MALAIEQLTALGLSREAVDVWKRNGIDALLPIQEKALNEHGFLHGKSLLVFAPTSSGKTFLAEMAALKHLERNRRVVYLAPTKALAEEKYRLFTRLYGAMGFRIAIATRERPDTDRTVFEGRYDLLIAVYEKMKSYLVSRPETLSSIALVIVDEIQTLGEPGRGAAIDLLLTKIRKSPYQTQLIGLSAVLGEDAQRLADWLASDLMIYRQRPIELREGILDLSQGDFHYQNFNARDQGQETLVPPPKDSEPGEYEPDIEDEDHRREALLDLARRLAVDHGEQVLLFVPTRYTSRNWAHHLCRQVNLAPAEAVLSEIDLYEETHSRELLQEVLRHGIAFHNADLSWDLRALIEEHFNLGAIRILVSTSTLGQGVNLKGRNVLHVPAMIATDRWTGRPSIVALSRGRFRNQGGRSARFSHEAEFGRSIIAARNPSETKRLLADYVQGEIEPLTPQIAPESLDLYALDLISSRVADTRASLIDFFHDTFSGRTLWRTDTAPIARHLDQALVGLLARNLISGDPETRLSPTGLGEVAAATGLHPATIHQTVTWLKENPQTLADDPVEALIILSATQDGRNFPAGSVGRADSAEAWIAPLRDRLLHRSEEATPSIRAILSPEGGFTRATLGNLKKSLALDAWIGDDDTRDIEERFGMYSGTLGNLASHIAWITQGAAALAKSLTLPTRDIEALATLAERLVLGCSPQGLAFRSLRVPGFSRAYLHALLREGYTSLECLAKADEDRLAHILPPRISNDLIQEARRTTTTKPLRPGETPEETKSEKQDSKTEKTAPKAKKNREDKLTEVPLIVDTRGTGNATFHGHELKLSRLEFRLLDILARSPEIGVDYERIERHVWPDAHVERQQVLAHRKGLLRHLSQVVASDEAKALVALKPGRGMRLTLPANQIQIKGDED